MPPPVSAGATRKLPTLTKLQLVGDMLVIWYVCHHIATWRPTLSVWEETPPPFVISPFRESFFDWECLNPTSFPVKLPLTDER